jgi:hypothetical protein
MRDKNYYFNLTIVYLSRSMVIACSRVRKTKDTENIKVFKDP